VVHSDSQSLLVADNSSNSPATLSSSSSSSSIQLYEEWGDDPLFSAATPPSLEQLQRKLVHVQRQLLQANSESLADVLTGEIYISVAYLLRVASHCMLACCHDDSCCLAWVAAQLSCLSSRQ
jgi:hypothetical protein